MADNPLPALPGAFQSYFDQHLDGMCVIDDFLGANAVAFRLLGYTIDDLSQRA